MSKFLLNILAQISKICQKFKFQIKFERISFLELWSSSGFQPRRDHLPSSPTSLLSPSPLGLGLLTGLACPSRLSSSSGRSRPSAAAYLRCTAPAATPFRFQNGWSTHPSSFPTTRPIPVTEPPQK
jgi:hypothetical protein